VNAVVQQQAEVRTDATGIIAVIERAALNPDIDVEKMERLLAMQERIMARNAEVAFNASMRAAQEEMPKVLRNRRNDQTSSKYADLEQVNEAIVPVYTKHGFSLSFGTGTSTLDGHILITCLVSHVEGYTRPYQCDMPLDMTGLKGNQNKTATHAHGSTMSYGRRYLTLLIFNITLTNEDTDGNKQGETISEEQLMDLKALAEEVGANKEQFLKYFSIGALADLPATKYKDAITALEKKRRKP
jgi:ERF superfamily